MKRSAQVALLLGGLTTAGATAYAVAPVRRDCPAPTSAAGAAAKGTTALPAAGAPGPGAAAVPAAARQEDCRPRRRYGTWGWSSGYWGSRGARPYLPGSGNRDASRANMAPSGGTATSRGAPASTSRGGFGSTGRSAGRGSS